MSISFDRIQHAHSVLSQHFKESPLLRSSDSRLRGDLLLKCESLQPTGSFKIRGATYRISQLSESQRVAGVIAYSTGNHAQAVAKAAQEMGIESTIVMSPDVPENKVQATRQWDAKIVMADANSESRRLLAEDLSKETGATLIPPYNDYDIMAGQGTIAIEIANQTKTLREITVYVPIGGGGLIAGVAAGLKSIEPTCKVIGVEPELEDDAYRSFQTGHIVAADGPSESIADAIKVQSIGELTFPLIQEHVDDIITVTEQEILSATFALIETEHLVIEPGGAVGYAAASRVARTQGDCHIALLCGGNVVLPRLTELSPE